MSEQVNRIPNGQRLLAEGDARSGDWWALRRRWRLLTRPARSISGIAGPVVSQALPLASAEGIGRRWRPGAAPSNGMPPWRWPSAAKGGRSGDWNRSLKRWRPLTAR